MKTISLCFFSLILFTKCTIDDEVVKPLPTATPAQPAWVLPKLPKQLEAQLRKSFKGAMPMTEYSEIIFHHLKSKYHINKEKILLGLSTCVDDIIYTKNFHNPEIKGPFHLGGLAGLPFTGISGLNALAHHIPEGGTLLLLAESHIGFTNKKGWGYILRHDQHELSPCCGALMGTLAKLQANKLSGKIREEDYQADKLAELALRHKDKILSAPIPIIELTKLTALEAEKQIRAHVMEVDMKHIKYIVILSGVMINTDYQYADYQLIKHIMIYDVKQKKYLEEINEPVP